MNAGAPDPESLAVFLIAAFIPAGIAQAAWLSAPASRRFGVPLDGGVSVRGRRVLGDNKTLRGFVVMVPAVGASFVLCASLARAWGLDSGLWKLSSGSYAALGLLGGLGFMLGELPNSFVKRRLDVAPGAPPDGAFARPFFAVADRLDSAVGLLVALSPFAPVPWLTWVYVLAVGPVLHGLFSLLTFRLGGKARAG